MSAFRRNGKATATDMLCGHGTAILALLIAVTMAFGGTPRWAWALMVVLAVLHALAWAVGVLVGKITAIHWSPMCLVFVAALLLVSAHMWIGRGPDPEGSREAVLKLAGYAAIYWIALQAFGGSKNQYTLANAVVAFGAAIALFAICQHVANPGTVYGREHGGTPFGPYINHNHFAGLIELLLPVSVAAMLHPKLDIARVAIVGLGVVLMLDAVALSGSRGGVLSIAVEMVLLAVVASSRMRFHRWRSGALVVVCIAIAVFSGLTLLDDGASSNRYRELLLNPEATVAQRKLMAQDALRLWMDHPIAGAGLGSFKLAILEKNSIVDERFVAHAHNDYLELLAEGGIIAGVIATIGATIFFACLSRHVRRARSDFGELLASAFGIGCAGLLLHSVADFNLHIPANAAWFVVFLAIVTSPATLDSYATCMGQGCTSR